MEFEASEKDRLFRALDQFRGLNVGDIMRVPLSVVRPTQPDDGRMSKTVGPLEAFYDKGLVFVQDGNHRYHDIVNGRIGRIDGGSSIDVRKVKNPYIDY